MDIGNVKIVMIEGEGGTSIASIQKTSSTETTETYTVTLEDDSAFTFEVRKGKSITGIEKVSSEGLIDTYNITFTDGEPIPFKVMNGQLYSMPTGGVVWYTGSTIPDGFEETDAPPKE